MAVHNHVGVPDLGYQYQVSCLHRNCDVDVDVDQFQNDLFRRRIGNVGNIEVERRLAGFRSGLKRR
jgi:hypothetical protein